MDEIEDNERMDISRLVTHNNIIRDELDKELLDELRRYHENEKRKNN